MAMRMCDPKRMEEITIEDLKNHRWCYYHNDDEGYDCFEHVIPDTHPDFSEHVIEMELAVFTFNNGEMAYGVYDGSESFQIISEDEWYSFWFGIAKPDEATVSSFKEFLVSQGYQLPVQARAIWSGTERIFNGLRYINESGEVSEIAI